MKYCCTSCDKHWSYPIKKCIFCGNPTQEVVETDYSVIGYTQVHVPSKEHEKVPYFDYLLEDSNGNRIVKKSYDRYEIGDRIPLEKTQEKNKAIVGVVGSGLLGFDIAEYLLRFSYPTVIKTRSKQNPGKLLERMAATLSKNSTPNQVSSYLSNLVITTDYRNLETCDIVIEAVPEDLEIKKRIFKILSETCGKKTIFATNTSSLSIDELANSSDRPQKCIGMHFFNPVSRMDLVEVALGRRTSVATKTQIVRLSLALKKKPIVVKDSPGFIVNRLLMPQINEAVELFENKVATKEDIDVAVKMGLNHPMGPLALADLIGIDTCVVILETLYRELGSECYKPRKLLYDMVKNGTLGRKTGQGFYKYP